MARYVEYSRRIFNIYLKYVAEEDIHAYSVDEVFMDVTAYLHAYQHDAHKFTATILQDVLQQTGITATAGIGTNLYLCKVAMDIVAKHLPADKDGLRIARLDETSYREQLWNHRPLTNFWRVGRSTAATLESYGIRTMGQLARFSLRHEALLHKLFGVNAELLIDHAWGWEPCTMQAIKAYHPETTSLGSGQVLSCPYTHAKARVVVHEMADSLSLDLVEKGLVTDRITLTIGYDSENLTHPTISADYRGETTTDHYGRRIPKNAHGTKHLCAPTSSSTTLIKATLALYDRITNPILLIRRLNLTLHHVKTESSLPSPPTWRQLNLFDDPTDEAKQQEKQQQQGLKERKMQETLLQIRNKYGKNAILKGINFAEGATGKERNKQIGGHKA